MTKMEMRNKIGCLDALTDDPSGDNIAIALATYFDDHPNRPENDLVDDEFGWGAWVISKTNDTIDRIVNAVKESK